MISTGFRERFPTEAAARVSAHLVGTGSEAEDRVVSRPRAVVEGLAGGIGALVVGLYKVLPGAVQGAVQAASASDAARPSTGTYTVTTLFETMAAGAGIGAFAGPIGAAVGTGAGFLVGVMGRVAEARNDTAREFVKQVDNRVDTYLTFNAADENALKRVTDGARVGAQTGFRSGLAQGWDAGVGFISTMFGK